MADDGANLSFMGILKKIYSSYLTQTPPKSRVLDTGALAAALTAVIVMLYSVVVGTHFPFNAFLAALFSCLGSAVLISKCERAREDYISIYLMLVFYEEMIWSLSVSLSDYDMIFCSLAVSLRMQLKDDDLKFRSPQRAFADYVFCNLILFLTMWNFMG